MNFTDMAIGFVVGGISSACAKTGMAPIDCAEMVDVSELLDQDTHFIYTGPVGRISGDYVWDDNGKIREQEHGGMYSSFKSVLKPCF